MLDRLASTIVARSRLLALLGLASIVLPLYALRNATIDNSIEVWLGTHTQEYQDYHRFLAKYGSEEFIVIAGQADDPLDDASLAVQRSLVDRLKEIDGVQTVLDVATPAELLSKSQPDWKELLQNEDLVQNLLLGRDGDTFGLIVWLKKLDDPKQRRKVVEQVEVALPKEHSLHLAGTPLMNVELDRGSQNSSKTFLPIAFASSLIILFVMLRSIRAVIAVVCGVAAGTIWTVGLLVASGRTLNMVTVVLPSLMFVLSLSSGIHIASRFLSFLTGCSDSSQAMRQTLREVARPILLSNLTTSVGFASLMVSDMRPVVDFGIFAALGMLLSFLFNLAIVPGLLISLHPRPHARPLRPHWTASMGPWSASRANVIVPASVIILAVSVLLTTQSKVEANVLKFFPDDSRIARDYSFIGQQLTGFYTVELDLTGDSDRGAELVKSITELSGIIEKRPEVANVIHYGKLASFLKDVPRPAMMPRAGVRDSPFKQLTRHYLVRDDGRISLRMSVLIRAMSSTTFYSLVDDIRRQASQVIDNKADVTITGVVPLLNAAQRSLIQTQIRSFSLAATVVLVLIGAILRSVRAFLAAILPNIVPIFALLAIMVLLKIPLDAATVMIAGVAIGIAADDTIHFLSHFRTDRVAGQDTITAVRSTFSKAGRAITFTSVVSTVGFVILCLAPFRPIRYFGLLAGVTMITAWLGDVLVLPACVRLVRLWDRNETFANTN